MANQSSNDQSQKYTLDDRTFKFSNSILTYTNTLPKNTNTQIISSQLVRAATSIGANYREADVAESRKDFVHKMNICKKECKETLYWLELLKSISVNKTGSYPILQEAHELLLIFSAIINKTKLNDQLKH